MNATRRVKLKVLNENLTCPLCRGYMIDATTTIECLHSFCKSCIVKHLDNSEYCPVCDVQLHSTKPLSGIRPDQMLQEIIYKLVPGLFAREMERRRCFYKDHPEIASTSPLDAGHIVSQPYITSDDKINLSLEYCTKDNAIQEYSRRYFHCPAGVTISVIKKLIQGKHDLKRNAQIEIMYGERILPDDFLLMDVAYKYSWTDNMRTPLQLRYQIRGYVPELGKSTLRFVPAKRGSRYLTDSEVLRACNVNTVKDLLSSSQTPKGSKIPVPNGKLSGRKRQNGRMSEEKEMTVQSKHCLTPNPIPLLPQDHVSKIGLSVMESSMSLQKEVHLQISEAGVISAKSLSSGEEKIISPVENRPDIGHLLKPSPAIVPSSSSSSFMSTPKSSRAVNGPVSSVQLKIPVVNCTQNSKDMKNNGPIKRKKTLYPADETNGHAVPNGGSKTDTMDRKKANVQRAIEDLQKQHLMTAEGKSNEKKNRGKTLKFGTPKTNGEKDHTNGLPHDIPLPFPLSALASSGMTVNVISPSELNKPSSLKVKETVLLPQSSNKSPKHQINIMNGSMKFTSQRQVMPSTSKVMTSPSKPRKFFKSRMNNGIEESPTKLEKAIPISIATTVHLPSPGLDDSKKAQSSITNGTSRPNMSAQNHQLAELKLINSNSSKRSETTTTPSRLTTMTTTTTSTTPMCSPFVPINHMLNYWNALQYRLPFTGIPQTSFLPFVTNDYISMPLHSGKPLIDPLIYQDPQTTLNYANLLYGNQSYSMGGSGATVYGSDMNGNKHEGSSTTDSTSVADLSNKRKRKSSGMDSLDLSIKKPTMSCANEDYTVRQEKERSSNVNSDNGHLADLSSEPSKEEDIKTPLLSGTLCEDDKDNNGNANSPSRNNEVLTIEESNEVSNNQVEEGKEDEMQHTCPPSGIVAPAIITGTQDSTSLVDLNGETKSESIVDTPLSGEDSNDSTSLVIHENVSMEQSSSPQDADNKQENMQQDVQDMDVLPKAPEGSPEISPIDEVKEQQEQDLSPPCPVTHPEQLDCSLKNSSICNNNNETTTAPIVNLSISSLDKLASSESSTGA